MRKSVPVFRGSGVFLPNSFPLSQQVRTGAIQTPLRIASKSATVSVACQNITLWKRESRETETVCSAQASLRDWNFL